MVLRLLPSDDVKNPILNKMSPHFSASLTPLEQRVFDRLSEIEKEGKFDARNVHDLKLLQEIFTLKQQKRGINLLLLPKVKWYLKVLLALNLSNKATLHFLKTNLLDILDVEELQYGRSLESPFLVGFNRDESGKIVPLYGNKIFQSERNISETGAGVLFSREPRKEVVLLLGAIKRFPNMELKKTDFWQLLPPELTEIFESGNILQTTSNDFYDIHRHNKNGVFNSESQAETLSRIDESIQVEVLRSHTFNRGSSYMLLYYGEYLQDTNGRTGVLMEIRDGKLEPVKVEINGFEYIVEVKGCGLRSGGFGEMQSRTGRDILSGGVEREQALEEFSVLDGISNGDGPKIAGVALFDNDSYHQGQVIRLSPSTVRASYTGNTCYPDIENEANIMNVLDMYVQGFVDMFFSNPPRIISRSSHTENLLLWGDKNFCWTDYSDQLHLNSHRIPFSAGAGEFLTIKKLLSFIIRMKKEIPGYTERFKGIFIGNVRKYFKEKGIVLGINDESSDDEITEEIWGKFLAYQTFLQKLNFHFFPERIEASFRQEKNNFLQNYKTLQEFKRTIDDLVEKLKSAVQNYLQTNDEKNGDNETVKILRTIISLDSLQLLNKEYLDSIFGKLFAVNGVLRKIVDLHGVEVNLGNTLLFIESEIDMLENAFAVANDEEKKVIEKGLTFYKSKGEYLKKINNFEIPLEEIFHFVENSKFEDFVFPDFVA